MRGTEDKRAEPFWIDDFNINPDSLVLYGPMGEVSLEPKVMQVLVTLAENQGQVVSRDEFMDKVWAVEFGSDESLTRAISVLRKSFGDAHGRRTVIETVPRRGYKLVAMVSRDGPMPPTGTQTATPPMLSKLDAVTVPGDTSNRRRKGAFAGLTAMVLIIAAFIGFYALKPTKNQTATETSVGVSTGEAELTSIAVLPFDDLSPNKDQDYFARGISEELLNVLAKTQGLRVTSRTSAFAFKDQGTPIAQIAKELDVGHILEGSVRKSGETLRITAQLIDPNTDVHLWSETYDRPLTLDNIFDIQDEITAAIVKALKGQLTVTPAASSRPVSLEAFELYIKARDDHGNPLPESLKAAEDGFRQVIDLDPDFAPAYSGLADTYILMWWHNAGLNWEEAVAKATPRVARALELAPDTAEALTSAARLEIYENEGDINKAEALARRAIAANPNYAPAYRVLGEALLRHGRSEDVFNNYQTALKLDPYSAVLLRLVSGWQMNFKQYEAARFGAEELLRLHPDSAFGHELLVNLEAVSGNYAQAHIHAQDAYALNPIGGHNINYMYYDVGLPDRALFYASSPYDKAYHAFSQGDLEKTRQYAAQQRDRWHLYFLYLIRDYEAAQPMMIAHAKRRSFLDKPIETEFFARVLMDFAFVFRETGEPFAHYTENLAAYYGDVPAAEISGGFALYNRSKFEILKGEPEKAYVWIDRFQELGFVTHGFEYPFFDEIRNSPEFQKRMAVNETLRAGYRKEIEAQLANPKPNWKLPEK